VGDGAKRTRGLEDDCRSSESDIGGQTSMVWRQEKRRQANKKNDFSVK